MLASPSTCLAAANSSASSSASALSASIRVSSGEGSGASSRGSRSCAAASGDSGCAAVASPGWNAAGRAGCAPAPCRGGSNGRVSSSSDWASSSDSRVAGSTGLPAPSVRSKEEPYLSLAEFMTDRHSVFHVTAPAKGERLDRVLAQHADLSRSRLKTLILAGAVTIGASTIRDPGHRVNAGDMIAVATPPDAPAEPAPEHIPLAIVHEDDALIVIDKPKGLVVHPAAGNQTGTLVNALIAHCGQTLSGIGGVKRPGIVHRLDKDTT